MASFLNRFDQRVYDTSPEAEAWQRAQQSHRAGEAANMALRPETMFQLYRRVAMCALKAVGDVASDLVVPRDPS